MKKSLIIIPFIIVIILIIGIFLFITGIKKDSEETIALMTSIKDYNKEFEKEITNYNEQRNNLLKDNSVYFEETFKENYEKIIKTLKDYDNTITYSKNTVVNLNNSCKDYKFSQEYVNTICKDFKKTYEQMVNIYINDINNFNNTVKTYNKNTNSNLEEYKSTNKLEYILFNSLFQSV